jgi:hypothetical protein
MIADNNLVDIAGFHYWKSNTMGKEASKASAGFFRFLDR